MSTVVVRLRDDALVIGRSVWVGRRPVAMLDAGLIADLEVGTPWVAARFTESDLGHLRRLALAGQLEWDLLDDAGALRCTASAVPGAGARTLPAFAAASTGEPSRFALLRQVAGRWTWESAASGWRIQLPDLDLVTSPDPGFTSFAAAFGLTAEADVADDLATWEFHDLLFARRARLDGGGGATFRFVGVRPPPSPAVSQATGARQRLLPPEPTATREVSYFDVVSRRRSVRRFETTIAVADVADLLFWTLRRTAHDAGDCADPRSYEALRRPVPGAGALHPIQAWVQAYSVTDLDRGTWWYDDDAHALRRVGDLSTAAHAPYDAPVQILLAYQHDRVAWKYEGIAHALALKDAGVMLGALHLTAVALGLASTIIGSGGMAFVVGQLGAVSAAMTPVGEIVVGRPVRDPTDQAGVDVTADVSVVPT